MVNFSRKGLSYHTQSPGWMHVWMHEQEINVNKN